jgi:integrase/recombinase XerD
MSTLEKALADYLALRRSLGYELRRPGLHMAEFVAYLEERGADTVTTEHAVAWARLPSSADPNYWHYRLYSIRGLDRYLHARDPAQQVPPDGLVPRRSSRATPYLYSNEEIAALIAAAGRLPHPLRANTYRTLIALLAATGMRGGEAIALDLDDVDWAHGLLVVRNGKFRKSREVALHDSTLGPLERYLERRRRLCPRPTTPALFVSGRGTRVCHCNLTGTFHQLTRAVGSKPRSASCRPRLHDLRHTFAIRTLLDWYREGVDVEARMPLLSTYLGHAKPAATYWYLSAAPELLALAGQRLEQHLEDYS